MNPSDDYHVVCVKSTHEVVRLEAMTWIPVLAMDGEGRRVHQTATVF